MDTLGLEAGPREHIIDRLGMNKELILVSLEIDPDDFDGREGLWMERSWLLRTLAQIDVIP